MRARVLRPIGVALLGGALAGIALLGGALAIAVSVPNVATAGQPPAAPQTVDSSSWVDDDARKVLKPAPYEQKLYAHQFREGIVEPISRAFDVPDKLIWLAGQLGANTKHEAANVNAYDEVSNSTWFTNRNHVRALPPEAIRVGWLGEELRPKLPWSIRSVKEKGVNPGFNIRDAAGKRWVVKLDPPGHPQLGSGADAVVTRLVWAAGFNVPHDVPIQFERKDLTLDPELVKGKDGRPPFTDRDLDSLLARGHLSEGGVSYGQASLFIEGEPIGPIQARFRRKDDANDLYVHRDRRELRGLFVLMSWLQSWDTKDHQTYQAFLPAGKGDSLGATKSYLLDLGGSLGASAGGAKEPPKGYENTVDWGWIARRVVTLGFVEETWRKIPQETGIPSVGNLDAAHYVPDDFRPILPHPAFSRRTLRDAYWGAKLVASFSDAQIAAAIDAAGYEDPRAKPKLMELLTERRDRVARHWFEKVAPLDFFDVKGGNLRFHDLAVDRRLVPERHYAVKLAETDGASERDLPRELTDPLLPLAGLGDATRAVLELKVLELGAEPVKVELVRDSATAPWRVALVRHA